MDVVIGCGDKDGGGAPQPTTTMANDDDDSDASDATGSATPPGTGGETSSVSTMSSSAGNTTVGGATDDTSGGGGGLSPTATCNDYLACAAATIPTRLGPLIDTYGPGSRTCPPGDLSVARDEEWGLSTQTTVTTPRTTAPYSHDI